MIRSFLVLAALVVSPALARADDVKADGATIARGAYLMNAVVGCGNCHTPKGPDGAPVKGRELSGGLVIDLPVFRAVAPNITQDKETGIGAWTDQQIATAIREGKRPDGSIIGPPMAIPFYRSMSDNDVNAMVAYLRTVKPISHKVEKSTYKIPLPPSYGPPVGHVADTPKGDKLAYGSYLVTIAHCLECHSPMGPQGPDLSKAGAGGRELPAFPSGVVTTPNLTSANKDGMAHWTDAQVKNTIRTGVRPDGRKLVTLMAFDWYKNITDSDLDAIVASLRTLKPATP